MSSDELVILSYINVPDFCYRSVGSLAITRKKPLKLVLDCFPLQLKSSKTRTMFSWIPTISPTTHRMLTLQETINGYVIFRR